MIKLRNILTIGLVLAALSLIGAGGVSALTCTNSFPTSTNGFSSSSCISSLWGNALENKIGINQSTSTTSLDYQINHIFTSWGSERIATTALPYVGQSPISISATGTIIFTNPSYITLTSLSATDPITYNNGTGALGFSNASVGFVTATSGLIGGAPGPFRFATSSDTNIGLSWSTSTASGSSTIRLTPFWIGSLAVGRGGTGGTSFTRGIVVASGTNAFATVTGTPNQVLIVSTTAPTGFAFATSTGGSGTPGGSDTHVQFNNAGAFGGSSALTWDGTANSFAIRVNSTSSEGGLYLAGTGTTATTSAIITFSDDSGENRKIYQKNGVLTIDGNKISTSTTSVAGSDTQVQFNDGGILAGDALFTWDKVASDLNAPTLNTSLVNNPSDSLFLQSGFGSVPYIGLNGGDGDSIFIGFDGYVGATGDGNPIQIHASSGGASSGSGGSVEITAGNGIGGDSNAGNINLIVGARSGAGSIGYSNVSGGDGWTNYASLDTSLIASSDKIFKFPNQSGTLGLILSATSTAIGGGSLAAGTCASATTTVTGALPTMTVQVTPATTTNVGDSAFWKGYVSNNNEVTTKVCESVLGTPVATRYNIRVTQ